MDRPADVEGAPRRAVDPLKVVARLAALLDADDFDSLATMLDVDVVYRIGGAEHRGPAAVVDSYREGSALARRIFERVEYSHEVVGIVDAGAVRVDFADALYAHGERLDHHSVQDVEVGGDGLVIAITDVPVEGQRERVDAFLARHGLTPPPVR